VKNTGSMADLFCCWRESEPLSQTLGLSNKSSIRTTAAIRIRPSVNRTCGALWRLTPTNLFQRSMPLQGPGCTNCRVRPLFRLAASPASMLKVNWGENEQHGGRRPGSDPGWSVRQILGTNHCPEAWCSNACHFVSSGSSLAMVQIAGATGI